MSKLKIAAISDLHGYLPDMNESADILLIAGDISPLKIQFNKPAMKYWLENEFSAWIQSLPVDRVYLTPGNHDAYFESISNSNKISLHKSSKSKLVVLINEVGHFYDNYARLWSIFGTPYCSVFGNWPFMREDHVLKDKFRAIPNKIDIIISHNPPFALGDCDVILENPTNKVGNKTLYSHIGSEELTNRLKDVDYKLLVCGHIHSGDHFFNKDYNTVNVSYLDESYSPRYKIYYHVLEK